ARRALKTANAMLRTRLFALGAAWNAEVTACEGRANLNAAIDRINKEVPLELRETCDALRHHLIRQMQTAAREIEDALVDELPVSPTLHLEAAPAFAIRHGGPNFGDDREPPLSVCHGPLAGTQDAFEHGRVKVGLGGAAAGAALGTAVFPGVGTAVGAVVG